MHILVNGKQQPLDSEHLSLAELIQRLGFAEKKIAVALNQEFVPKSERESIVLSDGDDVEIVAPMQGG